MEAGKLNRRVTLQAPDSGVDSIGQPLTGWVTIISLWASIIHKKGVQAIKADSQTSVVQASVRIRYRLDAVAGWRLICGDVIYVIQAREPDEVDRKYVDLVCRVIN